MSTKLARIADGMMEAAWLAALIIAPLFFNVFSSRIFEPDKITAIRSIALVALAAWIIKLIEQKQFRWTKLQPGKNIFETIRQTPLLLPVSLMVLSYLIATIFSVTWANSLYGSYQRLQGTYSFLSYVMIFAVIAGNMRKRAQVERLLTTAILSSLPVSLYGILQRYQLDPIPWGGDTTVRVASNMGNSIFVAAYLIMIIPLTLARVISSFQAILKENGRQAMHVVRASLYLFILILELVTIYMSGSRGPLLGLMGGMYFMMLLLSLMWRKRWLTYAVILASLIGGGFLAALNIPNGPLEAVRKSPLVGRFGSLLDTESNTAQVRYYIWLGASHLVLPHDPLEYPDGSKDVFNLIRPLIGYGPESMYVAYNPFYEPMLGHVERRNASPDRSHNETWDSLVTQGLFGFATYIALFSIAIYYGLHWLGLIETRRLKMLFWGLVFAGGLIGAVAVIAWNGLPYLGVGLPFGLIVGVLIYIAVAAVVGGYQAPVTASGAARSLTLIVLLAAVIAHWIEINFGIAIVSTRIHFWSYLALLFVVGLVLPKHGEYDTQVEHTDRQDKPEEGLKPAAALTPDAKSRQNVKRAKKTTTRPAANPSGFFASPWLSAALANGMVLSILMATLGYDYITNPTRGSSALDVIFNSFTYLAALGDKPSFALFGLIFSTLLVSAFIYSAESEQVNDVLTWLKSSIVASSVALVLMVIYALIHAGRLSSLASATITTEAELIDQVRSLGGLLTNWYIYTFLLLAGAAWLLSAPAEKNVFTNGLGGLLSPVLLIVVSIIITFTNLQVIHADIAFKMAEPFTSGDQWPIATRLYNEAISLAPNEDYYYLFIGRSYLEQAKLLTTEGEQAAVVEQADKDLKTAQQINPLNTDHTANLARLYSWWATRTTDAATKKQRGEISANYYTRARTLSRNSATIWGESAVVDLNILDKPQEAKSFLDKAIELDPQYPFVLSLMGDYYVSISATSISQQLKVQNLETGISYYDKAIQSSVGRDAGSQLNYAIAKGNVYLDLATLDPNKPDSGRLNQAIAAFEQAGTFTARPVDITKLEEQLGRIYIQLKDKANALLHLQKSLDNATATADKDRLNQLIAQVNTMP